MAVKYIPYNPQTDPRQYLTQALQNYGQASLKRRQKREFEKGLSPTMTPFQIMQHALKYDVSPQEAIKMASVVPSAYEKAKTVQALQPKSLSPTQQIAARKLALINRLEAIPSEKRTKGQQAKLDKALIGQPLVQIGLGKPASAAERTSIAEARASMDALDNIKNLYDESYVGPIKGRVAPGKGLFGFTEEKQEEFMAATSAFKNSIIKQITGAQMSEPEAKRIMKQIPDITDPPARWKAKHKQSLKNIKMMEKRKLQILKQSGIRVPEETKEDPLGLGL
jgi:hypothetical protein